MRSLRKSRIDSVKLAKCSGAARALQPSEKPDIPRAKLKTIAGIVDALTILVRAGVPRCSGAAPEVRISTERETGTPTWPASEDHASGMISWPACGMSSRKVTRYPLEILEPECAIGRRTRIEFGSNWAKSSPVLRERYAFPRGPNIPRAQLKTSPASRMRFPGLCRFRSLLPRRHPGRSPPLSMVKKRAHHVAGEPGPRAPGRPTNASCAGRLSRRYPISAGDPGAECAVGRGTRIDSVKSWRSVLRAAREIRASEKLDIPARS